MKKLLAMVVAGGMLAFSASAASAVDIKVKGAFDFGFGLYDGTSFTKHADEEHFDANQRLRTQVDFIASESLKGVFQVEVGTTPWGKPGGATWGDPAVGRHVGFGMGGDSVSIEVKHMYLDWLVPNTDLQVRMGLQPFALPTAVNRGDWGSGSPIFDDDMAGILLSYDFNENVGINLGWFRPWDADTGSSAVAGTNRAQGDEIDLFALTLPIEVADSFKFTPSAVFAKV
ncbi:MAG: porin, partial [Desulfovibrionaceae bacterium]|nr:porin [Desulfovibrionaceae bacterium]